MANGPGCMPVICWIAQVQRWRLTAVRELVESGSRDDRSLTLTAEGRSGLVDILQGIEDTLGEAQGLLDDARAAMRGE